MARLARTGTIALAAFATLSSLQAIDPDRDFSGQWILDPAHSTPPAPKAGSLTVTTQDNANAIQCVSSTADGSPVQWNYALDGSDTRYTIGQEHRNSKVKWEGRALLVNTIVTGPSSYSILDRWTLSPDRTTLTIDRQALQGGSQTDAVLRYRRAGQPAPVQQAAVPQAAALPQALVRPAEPATPPQIVVPAGTRIPLSLRNAIDTKHSHEGDRVYLDTLYPVVINNRIIIPRGSYVSGTLTTAKPAGVIKGKGELYIRFDSLILPNGVTRDFRSRLASADTTHGTVDRQEGTITGERDKSGEAKTTAEGAGIGAGIGGLAGAAAGHPLTGVGVGAAAGAAVGLASVLTRHRAEASLPRGTTVEMLLDRDLYYLPSELSRGR